MLGALVRVEAADVAGVRIAHVRVAVRHPLGDELGDARALLDPHRGGRPQVAHLDRLAEHRHGVGGERQQPVDGVADLGRLEDVAHQLDRLLELLVEVVVGERQLGGRQRGLVVARGCRRDGGRSDGGRSSPPPSSRPTAARSRRCPCPGRSGRPPPCPTADEHVDRPDVGHLVHRRRERDRRAGHARRCAGSTRRTRSPRARPRCGPRSVTTAAMAPSTTSRSSTSVLANTCRCRRRPPPRASACRRCSESTTDTRRACRSRRAARPSLMNGTSSLISAGVSRRASMPHAVAEVIRRLNSSSRSVAARHLDAAARGVDAHRLVLAPGSPA